MAAQLVIPQIVGMHATPEQLHVEYAQRVGTILNDNEEARKNSDENWNAADPDIKKVGSVPRVVWLLWEQMGITNDSNELLKALERNQEFKTTEKKLI